MSKHKRPQRATQQAEGKAAGGVVVNQIIVKAPNRKVLDVGDWRKALKSAEFGRPKQLFDLFDDVLLDGVLGDAVQKRIDAVTNSDLTFQGANGEAVEEMTDLVDSLAFEELLAEIVKAKMWGRSAVEFEFGDAFRVHPIPAKHISLHTRSILINDTDERGISYEGDPFVLVLGKERDFGLILKAAPLAIYKRGGFGDWSQWVELFGMPRRIGKYNVYDPESRKLMEEALARSGSAPYLITPIGTEIQTEQTNPGTGSSYDEFRKACNEEILVTILGQTMTTMQGDKGARSLGEVHKEVEEGKNRSDLRFVQRVLNEHVIPILEARGFPVSGGRFIFPDAAEPLSVADVVQLSDILPIPQSFLHDKYAIPAPKGGEPIARRAPAFDLTPPDDPDDNGEDDPDTPDNPTKLSDDDVSFFSRIRRFFASAPSQGGAYTGKAPIALTDTASLNERLMARVAGGEASYFDFELFEYLSNDLVRAIRTTYKRSIANADYTYNGPDDAYLTALEMNLFHFSAAKTLAEVQELNKLFRESKSFAEFTAKASMICDKFNRAWQKTEYETAVLTAEAASTYHRLKGKKNIFPYWQYNTVGDERVREEHEKIAGVVLPVDDPVWGQIYPPNGWKCRCRVDPKMAHEVTAEMVAESRTRVKEYIDSPEWAALTDQGWGVNRAESAEVFGANQMYIRKFPGKAAKYLGKLYYNDYGLDSFGKKMEAANTPAPKYEGEAGDWHDSHKLIEDYNGRKVAMTEEVFIKHTTKKYTKTRVPLLECIPDVLKNPDEVWINDYVGRFSDMNFIKFYEGKCIVVICEITAGRVYQIKTWFEIHAASKPKESTKASRAIDPRWRYRRGLLIKKG